MFFPSKTAACLAVFWSAAAAGPAFAVQSLPELEARLDAHPSLTALRLRASAEREAAGAAGALPDPVVSLGVNNLPLSDPALDRFLPTNRAFGVRQDLPDRLTRRARTEAAIARGSALEVEREAMRASLRARLHATLAERAAAAERLDMLRRQGEIYDALLGVVEAELAGGSASAFRLGEVDRGRARLAQRLAELEGEAAGLDARLAELVGDVPEPPALPDIAPSEWSGAAGDFYDVALAAARIRGAEAGVDAARGAYRPDWGVSVTYQQREASAEAAAMLFPSDDWVSAGVTFTVPLYAGRSQAPRLRAARAEKAAAEAQLQAAARNAQAAWRGLSAQARAAGQSAEAISRQIDALDERIASARTQYEAGYGDYAAVLDGEILRLDLLAELAAARARQAGLTARANSLLVTP